MQEKKDVLGKIFFIISVVFLIYTLISPLNHIFCYIDEYFTLTVTNLPLQDIITVTAGDVHPPLYYIMAKIVFEISKILNFDTFYSLKLLSNAAFVLILGISGTKIRKDYGWLTAGLFALAISVMSEFGIYHLIIRMYSWAILFIIITFLSLRNIINNKNDKKSWIIFTLFSVMAAYTHYFAAITAVCLYLILLIYLVKNNKSEIKNWVLSVISGVILYLPWTFILLNQLIKIKKDFWIPPIQFMDIIGYLGYYAYDPNTIICIAAIIFLAIIGVIYLKEKDHFSKNDQILILFAFGAYFGSILIGVLVSELYKPILYFKYLMPAAAILWLIISIILGKIKNKKLFIIMLALISVLLVSGIVNTFMTFDVSYHEGLLEKEYFDNISQEDNAVLIIDEELNTMFFLCKSEDINIYCINTSDILGLSSDEIHKHYNYTDLNKSQIDEFILNNTDKNIYYMYWDEKAIKSPIEWEINYYLMHYSKINTANLTDNITQQNQME